MSRYYGIDGIEEARAYLADPVLRANPPGIAERLRRRMGSNFRFTESEHTAVFFSLWI